MTKTVIACYDDFRAAQRCAQDLARNGFDGSKISIVASGVGANFSNPGISGMDQFRRMTIPGVGAVMATGSLADKIDSAPSVSGGDREAGYSSADPTYDATRGTTARSGMTGGAGTSNIGDTSRESSRLRDALTNIGIPLGDADSYAECVRRGGTLVSLPADDDNAQKASDIMGKYDPADIHGRAGYWKQHENWQGFDAGRPAMTEDEIRDQRAVVPKIEEELRVGKREVETGGLRVHTYVTEKPVEKTVNLRQESVDVQRRKVDRPATEEDLQRFKEQTIRIPVITEEADVSKQARVTEEVVIRKDVDTEPKKVQGSVRETHVDTERVGKQGERTQSGFDQDDARFRRHFDQSYEGSDHTYEQYRPAYQYGYNLGTNSRFQSRKWDQVEPEAKRRWEETNPDAAWDAVDDAVEAGFKGAKGEL